MGTIIPYLLMWDVAIEPINAFAGLFWGPGGGAGGHRVREEEEAEAEGAWDPRERISACGGTSG